MPRQYQLRLGVGRTNAEKFRQIARANNLSTSELGEYIVERLAQDPTRLGLVAPLEQRFAGIPCDLDAAVAQVLQRG